MAALSAIVVIGAIAISQPTAEVISAAGISIAAAIGAAYREHKRKE